MISDPDPEMLFVAMFLGAYNPVPEISSAGMSMEMSPPDQAMLNVVMSAAMSVRYPEISSMAIRAHPHSCQSEFTFSTKASYPAIFPVL